MKKNTQDSEVNKEFGDGIISIDKFKFERRYRERKCIHERRTYDPYERTIECDDCGKFIDPFQAFLDIVSKIDRIYARLNAIRREVDEAKEKEIILLAAKKVEKAWRSRNMVPTCPHCHQAIFPSDGFGGSFTSKEMEIQRRKFKKHEQ
jgi:hypothetical protein